MEQSYYSTMEQNNLRRAANISPAQKKKLIELLNADPELLSGKFSVTFTYKVAQERWAKYSTVLNAIPGAAKTWQMWRKAWQDLRCKAKGKQSIINKLANTTGGGPPSQIYLTDEEEHILSTINSNTISGHREVGESMSVCIYDSQPPLEDSNPTQGIEIDSDIENRPSTSTTVHQSASPLLPQTIMNQSAIIPMQTPSMSNPGTSAQVDGSSSMRQPRRRIRMTAAQRRLQSCTTASEILTVQAEKKFELKRWYYTEKNRIQQLKVHAIQEGVSVLKEIASTLKK